jgi:exopolysaccharide biosynthesis protein
VRNLSAAILFCALAAGAPAAWTEKDSRDETSTDPNVLHRHVVLADSETGRRAIVDLAIFGSKSCRLRLIDNEARTNLAAAMPSTNCVAAVNGGYFDPSFAPLGLRIIEGKVTSRLARGHLLSGILASNGSVQILRNAEFSKSKKYRAAIGCGPFLVDLARPVRGLEATRAARRTFAAFGSNDRAALGFCSDATLAEIALILSAPLGDFTIQRALNLDGGSSSAFWFRRKDGSVFSISEQKSVRDFVGVGAR